MDKREKALKKFGYIEDNTMVREEIKVFAEKLQKPELKIFSHWSRSVIGNNYDLRHPSFVEYKEHYQKGDVDWLPEGITHVNMDKYLKNRRYIPKTELLAAIQDYRKYDEDDKFTAKDIIELLESFLKMED